MRWPSSVLIVTVAPILKLTGGLLSRPLGHGGDWLHASSRWLLADGRHCFCCGRRGCWSLLLRKALLESFHQINDRGQMRLGDFGNLLAFELGGNHGANVLLILITILLPIKRSRKTLDQRQPQVFPLLFAFHFSPRDLLAP